MSRFSRSILSVACAFFALLLLVYTADAGPLGIFGGGRISSGGCSSGSGSCGGGSSSMMMSSGSSWGSSAPAWGSSAPTMRAVPETHEVGSLRTLDFYVNVERARMGLAAVIVDPKMNAELQAATNANAKAATLVRASLPYAMNIDRGSSNSTAEGAVKAWMQDEASRNRILAADYKTCGYAKALGSDGKVYWALAMAK